jgi:GH25 family lysozyme M1 (1,4-beta-N-acetylmuramidase)
VYSGEYFYNRNLKNVSAYTKWIARYNSNNGKQGTKPNVSAVAIWQYSSRGKVAGVSGYVDVNVAYVDLVKSVTGKDYIQAARDVWANKYGTDPERSAKLKAEGFDPRIVQHFVNRLAR